MKDSIVCHEFNSPSRDSFKHVEGCYGRGFLRNNSFISSRRALRSSADKISQTFRTVRNTFGILSQHLRFGNRRQRLSEAGSPCQVSSPATPVIPRKQILGRSPAKLYSPFGIETPHNKDYGMSPYMPNTPENGLSSPIRRKGVVQTWHVISKKRPRALFH